MKLIRLEEFISEVTRLAVDELDHVIHGLTAETALEDSMTWRAYMKMELCEELGLIFHRWISTKTSHILDKMVDLLDQWECEGFWGYQVYSQERWAERGLDVLRSEAKIWVAREMLQRIRGAR